MDMPAALRTRLLAYAPLAQLVGSRVTWMIRPQETALPAVVLQTITDERPQHYKGFQALRSTRVRADTWATTYGAARAVSEALIAAAVPEHRGNGIHFRRAQVGGPRDLMDDDATKPLHRSSVDLILWWSAI